MTRKLHVAGDGPDGSIRIADEQDRIVCTLPWQEDRLAKFIVASVNVFGFRIKRYDRSDWEWGTTRNAKAT